MKPKATPSSRPTKTIKSTTARARSAPSEEITTPQATAARRRPVRPPAARERSERLVTEEAIALRAYELFESRGSHGTPLDDWLQAERELMAPPRATKVKKAKV